MPIPETRPLRDNRGVLQETIQWRRRTWFIGGLSLFIVSFLYGLFICPQYFTSSVSISMQQPSYVLRARRVRHARQQRQPRNTLVYLRAARLPKRLRRGPICNNCTAFGARAKLSRRLCILQRFDDNAVDGLIYIDITLDAPPKLQPNSSSQRERVRAAAAVVANAYSDALRNWLITQDTEKDSVLLREAAVEVLPRFERATTIRLPRWWPICAAGAAVLR